MSYNKSQQKWIKQNLCALCGGPKTDKKVTCLSCRERTKVRTTINQSKMRDEVLAHYGGSCVCCSEDRRAFLAIDHMPGTSRKGDQRNLTFWLVKNKFPEGF